MSVRAYELEMAGIAIREEYAPLLPLVLANREEIQQVILNLVMNAQQAMSDPDGARVLSVRTFMSGVDAVLEVRDTGPGIPAELAGQDLRAVLHDQVGRRRARARAVAVARDRQRASGPAGTRAGAGRAAASA